MKAWYFSGTDKKLRYGDNREIKLGETHAIVFPCENKKGIFNRPTLCKCGLHGSVKILDALAYASGPVIWKVELTGMMDKGADKISAEKRTYLSGGTDISGILSKFARMCAAAESADWSAAWSAAWKKQNARLTRMVNKAIKEECNK